MEALLGVALEDRYHPIRGIDEHHDPSRPFDILDLKAILPKERGDCSVGQSQKATTAPCRDFDIAMFDHQGDLIRSRPSLLEALPGVSRYFWLLHSPLPLVAKR